MDKIIGVSETRSQLPFILKNIAGGMRYIITQRSHVRAVLISPEDIESLEVAADRDLLDDLRAAQTDIRNGRYEKAKSYFTKKKR